MAACFHRRLRRVLAAAVVFGDLPLEECLLVVAAAGSAVRP